MIRYMLPITIAVTLSFFSTLSHASCVTATFTEGVFKNKGISVSNSCRQVIHYSICVKTNLKWPHNVASSTGYVYPNRTGKGTIAVPSKAKIINSKFTYCEGARCSPAETNCF